MITVAFQSDTVRIQHDVKKRISAIAQTLAREIHAPDVECGVLFVGDKRIQYLNKKHRGKDAPTDVLSFAMRDAKKDFPQFSIPRESEYIGEIIINMEYVRRVSQTSEEKYQRTIFLFIHGLLHLFQYDHQSKKQLQEMRKLENHILKGNTFYEHDDY